MSYQIALSALQAINSQLDTISQNIANTGTTGYKSSRTNFSAMYSSSAPNGVRASSTTQTLDMSGGLLSTGRNLDVAIAGKGYFMVKDSTGVMNYTRVGVFDVDKQGYVVDHMGRQVQGYAQQPGSTTLGALGELKVPTGQIPAKASSSVDFVGNLSADWVARPWRLIPRTPAATTAPPSRWSMTRWAASTRHPVFRQDGEQRGEGALPE
jgi:flagellar hook protein FlgE